MPKRRKTDPMTPPITTLLFDFDGTLADTTATILKAMRLTIAELGLPLPGEGQMKSGIGLPLKACIQQAGNVPDELADRAGELYHRYFKGIAFGTENINALPPHPAKRPGAEAASAKEAGWEDEGATVLYDGVKETLERLHSEGYVLGIATSRKRETLDLFLRNFGIRELFSAIATVENATRPKPAPDTVLYDLDLLGRKPEETLVIGDATYDILMGRSAGCRTCAVTYGNQDRNLLQTVSPDWMIDSMRELPGLL